MTDRWVFLDGKFILENLATIPITNPGFLFGEGIFTTIRVYQGKCELLRAHLQRLEHQARVLNIDSNSWSLNWISELIALNNAQQGLWRLKIIVTPRETKQTAGYLVALLQPYQVHLSDACSLCLFPRPLESPLADLKSLSYLNHLYVRRFAEQQGYADAITQTQAGILLETGYSNLFWIDQDQCFVPDLALPYLKGIFLQALLSQISYPIQFVKATLQEIPANASFYICNALTHVRPVLSIDQRFFQRHSWRETLIQHAISRALQA